MMVVLVLCSCEPEFLVHQGRPHLLCAPREDLDRPLKVVHWALHGPRLVLRNERIERSQDI
jgi:hypothetical protein